MPAGCPDNKAYTRCGHFCWTNQLDSVLGYLEEEDCVGEIRRTGGLLVDRPVFDQLFGAGQLDSVLGHLSEEDCVGEASWGFVVWLRPSKARIPQ